MRILHIAPFNIAGVPLSFVRAERMLGYDSRLMTLGRNEQGRDEDICLNLPLLDNRSIRFAKILLTPKERRTVTHVVDIPAQIPVQWKPGNLFEAGLFQLRERLWNLHIKKAMTEYDFWNFDVYQLDSGMEFFRDGRTVRQMKEKGKKVICCYTGSDLRVRGVIPMIDSQADINVTVEYDHLRFHPQIHHVPFPLDTTAFPVRKVNKTKKLRIGHAPTNRAAKGSNEIISVIQDLSNRFPVELLLIENLPFYEALREKATCDIFIDQIGNLGYGMNGLEALSMGIPTCSSLAPGFAEVYPDHPFQAISGADLESVLIPLIKSQKMREHLGKVGRKWVQHVHDPLSVVKKIHELAGLV